MLGKSSWIDVSHHQGVINWPRVAGAGIDGAIVRIGDSTLSGPRNGAPGEDSRYEENVVGAIENGLFVAAYHFWYDHIGAHTQREIIRGILGARIPSCLFIDVEDFSFQSSLTRQARTNRLMEMVDLLLMDGYRIGFYTAKYTWDSHIVDTGRWNEFVQWVAYWPGNPSSITSASQIPMPSGWDNLEIWQYSAQGRVVGISGDVDRNRGVHDIEWYQRWHEGVDSPVEPPVDPPPPSGDLEERVRDLEDRVYDMQSALKEAGEIA